MKQPTKQGMTMMTRIAAGALIASGLLAAGCQSVQTPNSPTLDLSVRAAEAAQPTANRRRPITNPQASGGRAGPPDAGDAGPGRTSAEPRPLQDPDSPAGPRTGSRTGSRAGGNGQADGSGNARPVSQTRSNAGARGDATGASLGRTARAGYYPEVTDDQIVEDMFYPTGDVGSSPILLHTVMPREVSRGARFEYEYHVTNIASGSLDRVTLVVESLENLADVRAEPRPTEVDGNIAWDLGTLQSGETRVIEVSGRADELGTTNNCVSVAYTNSLCAGTRVTEPRLAVEKEFQYFTAEGARGGEALVCEPVDIVYVVRNPGTGAAANVVLKDTLPEGLRITGGGREVYRELGTVPPGESVEVVVTVEADEPGVYRSPVSATAGAGLEAENAGNSIEFVRPELEITSECRDFQYILRTTSFAFDVSNVGDGVARDGVITVTYPADLELVEPFAVDARGNAVSTQSEGEPRARFVRRGVIEYDLGSLEPGGDASVNLTLRSTLRRDVTVRATAEAFCADAVEVSCTTEYRGIPAILLEVVDEIDPVEVGDETIYEIRVTNQGTATDTGIVVTARLPRAQQFIRASGPTSVVHEDGTVEFSTLERLAPGAVATWRMTVRALEETDARLFVQMTSDQFEEPVTETESTNQYE